MLAISRLRTLYLTLYPTTFNLIRMADRNRMRRNGGMNDGIYRIEITGDETWEGWALHYMRRDELMHMWSTIEERHQ